MKTAIGTAHGWISVQPDGRVEFRPLSSQPGPWEIFDFPGFSQAPSPQPPQPPSGDVGQPTAAYVAEVKARLEAAGVPLSGPCGAFNITKQVAWDLRASGYGLVAKPSGNNCEGYSVDYLCLQNGDGVDILSDAGGTNGPQWAEKPGEFAGQNRWREPIRP